MLVQAVEQVFWARLFGSAPGSDLRLWRGWVGRESLGNERIVLGLVVGQAVWGQGSLPCRGRCDFGLDGTTTSGPSSLPMPDRIARPQSAVRADDGRCRMRAHSRETGGRRPSGHGLRHPDSWTRCRRLACRHAPVMGISGSAWLCWRHLPLQPPLDTQAALIEMDDRGGEELLLDARPTHLGAGKLTVVGDDDRLRGRLSRNRQQLGCAPAVS